METQIYKIHNFSGIKSKKVMTFLDFIPEFRCEFPPIALWANLLY